MKRFIWFASLMSILSLASGCNTYYVASVTAPEGLYLDQSSTQLAYNVPVGTVLLLKGHAKNGMLKVRYHSNPNWYWMADGNYNLVPSFNPKLYSTNYYSYENNAVQGGSYDATIQTGTRGGKYYINKNGNKTYVKRSTPSGTVKHVRSSGRH